MPRIVRGGLIQATLCEPATSPVEKIKQAMIDKHVALIGQAAEQGRRGRLPAGAVLRAVLLRRAGDQVVQPHREDSGRPDHQADAGAGQEAQDGHGRSDVRGRSAGRVLQLGGRHRRRRASTWASSARFTSPIATRAFGRSFTSGPATWAIRSSTRRSARSAFTFATTATSRTARGAWAWAARRSCSTPRPRWRG